MLVNIYSREKLYSFMYLCGLRYITNNSTTFSLLLNHAALNEYFNNTNISINAGYSCVLNSRDLTLQGYFLCRFVKSKVSPSNPQTIPVLKVVIQTFVNCIYENRCRNVTSREIKTENITNVNIHYRRCLR